MSYSTFQIIYDGPALTDNTMDVNDLAPALLALGNVIETANLALNDKKATVSVRVKASFKTGCFGIEFNVVQSLLEQTKSLFVDSGISSAKEIVEYIGFSYTSMLGLIGLLRLIKNRKIKEVIPDKNSTTKLIIEDDAIVVDNAVIELYRNVALRKALQKAITEQLEKEGIDSVAFKVGEGELFNVIEKDERAWFEAGMDDYEISDNEVKMVLIIESPVFKKDNKWKFNTGGSGFYVDIADAEFLRKVETGEERFGKGDYLTAMVTIKQYLGVNGLKTEHTITKVLEHKSPPMQQTLPD